jgi:hypothetical protein
MRSNLYRFCYLRLRLLPLRLLEGSFISLNEELIYFQLRQLTHVPLKPSERAHPIFVILDPVPNIINICPATISLIIGFLKGHQFTVTKINATIFTVDSVRFINDRIVSGKVE